MTARGVVMLVLVGILGSAACGGSGLRPGDEVTPGVAFLGAREVNFHVDRDHMVIGARAGRFSAVRIEVADAPLEMYDIRIVFGDGSSFSPETRLQFHENDHSRRIDLPGGQRVIREITFLYRSDRPALGRARVQVFGVR
jgi:hypothetical protein